MKIYLVCPAAGYAPMKTCLVCPAAGYAPMKTCLVCPAAGYAVIIFIPVLPAIAGQARYIFLQQPSAHHWEHEGSALGLPV
jgi:hypothetical protein